MTTTPLEVLVRARERLSRPENWIKGDYAKDLGGNSVCSDSYSAVCWCILGAIGDDTLEGNEEVIHHTLKTLQALTPAYSVPDFNDDPNTTYEDVIRVLDKAIAITAETETQP
jgi:hypothetical protein